jgi:hypothetical protein
MIDVLLKTKNLDSAIAIVVFFFQILPLFLTKSLSMIQVNSHKNLSIESPPVQGVMQILLSLLHFSKK